MIDNEYSYKGKIRIAKGQTYISIYEICGDRKEVDFKEIEQENINELTEELEKLSPGLYELEIDYEAWEESYPESNVIEGDYEFKILSIKKLEEEK